MKPYIYHFLVDYSAGVVQVVGHGDQAGAFATCLITSGAHLQVQTHEQILGHELRRKDIRKLLKNLLGILPDYVVIDLLLLLHNWKGLVLQHFDLELLPMRERLHLRQNSQVRVPVAIAALSQFE